MSKFKSGHSFHMHLCIAGALRRTDKELNRLFEDDATGRLLTGKQARQWLLYNQNQGKRVLPMGKCDNFDYQEGCLGHPLPELEAAAYG